MMLGPASSLKQAVEIIRTAPLENLRSVQWLERELLPAMGFPAAAAPFLPENLRPFCGLGLQSFQAPNQFARYLRFLADQSITSYLEIGTFQGGTFALTVEYLSRFCDVADALAIDVQLGPNVVSYAKMNSATRLLEGTSRSPKALSAIQSRMWDLAFIDGDHGEDACWQDFLAVRETSRLVALHDTFNDITPGVEAVWKRITSVIPSRFVHEFHEQYISVAIEKQQRYFGIGVVEFVPV